MTSWLVSAVWGLLCNHRPRFNKFNRPDRQSKLTRISIWLAEPRVKPKPLTSMASRISTWALTWGYHGWATNLILVPISSFEDTTVWGVPPVSQQPAASYLFLPNSHCPDVKNWISSWKPQRLWILPTQYLCLPKKHRKRWYSLVI